MINVQIPPLRKTIDPPLAGLPTMLDRTVMLPQIPNTAGTSFIGTFRNIFGRDGLVRLAAIDDSPPGEVGRQLSERPNGLACLAGHIPFHTIAPWRDRGAIFTILRDPIARVMSLFRFIQKGSPSEKRRLRLRTGFTFRDIITSQHPELYGQIHNGMTGMPSGDPRLSTPDSPLFWATASSRQAIDAALRTLDSIDFGLAEDMGNTLRTARVAWGIPFDLDIGRENVINRRRIKQPGTGSSAFLRRNRQLPPRIVSDMLSIRDVRARHPRLTGQIVP